MRGLSAAESVLTRIDPLDLSSLPDPVLQRTRDLFGADATPESSVLQMLRDVRADGDSAVRRYASLLDGAELDDMQVPEAELESAWDSTPDDLKRALELAARRITEFHEATLPPRLGGLGRGFGRVGAAAGASGVVCPWRHRRVSFHRLDDRHTSPRRRGSAR